MWHGEALARKRRKMTPRNWSMVYMQDQVADDAIFKQADVQGCIDRARYPGRMFDGQPQHRPYGMDGLMVVAGLDPAAAGCTSMVVVGLDRRTGVRWVLDVVNKRAMPPHEMRSEMERLTERYGITEWRVEKNAYQASIVQDQLIRSFLSPRLPDQPAPHEQQQVGHRLRRGEHGHPLRGLGQRPEHDPPAVADAVRGRARLHRAAVLLVPRDARADRHRHGLLVRGDPLPGADDERLLRLARLAHEQLRVHLTERDAAGQMVVDIDKCALQQQGAGAWGPRWLRPWVKW
jgi:hypothetical protein